VRILELLDRLGLADAAVARGVKTTTVEIYEQGRAGGIISRWQIKAQSLSRHTRSRSPPGRTRPNNCSSSTWQDTAAQ
jgi:hypothetical protein